MVDRARPAGRRRPRLGRRPAGPDAADPRRRRGRPVPRDRAVVPAERRAVRRRAGRVRAGDASARTAGRGTSSSSRASCRRRCRARRSSPSPRRGRATSAQVGRHAHEPGHRHARSRTSRSCATSTCRRPTSPRPRGSTCPTGRARSSRARAARRCSTPASATGCPAAVLAFEPRRSDLPLQVAFPILLANLTGELLGGSDGARPRRVEPGTPVELRHPGRGDRRDRDAARTAAVDELVPGTTGGAAVTFAGDRPARASTRSRRSPTRTRRPRHRPAPAAAPRRVRGEPPSAGARRRRGRVAASPPPRRPAGPGPVRGRPVRRRRVDDRARVGGGHRGARHDRPAPRRHPAPAAPAAATSGRRPATSCGSRSSCSCSSSCASSGRSTTATALVRIRRVARRRGCGATRAGPPDGHQLRGAARAAPADPGARR